MLQFLELQSMAERHLNQTYSHLLDRYKYIIGDMDGNTFRKRAPEIIQTGQELMDHFIVESPSKVKLKQFSSEVDESMKESLFEILIDNGVDLPHSD